MTFSAMPQTEMIDTKEQLEQYLGTLKQRDVKVCAVDTEADSLHRYEESLCLIQFSDGDECSLIDPLSIDDLKPLSTFLADTTVWMHGADYDMTMFKREFGEIPAVVFDTQIGARLLGARRYGLADLVLEYFGIELSKTSQKADWGKRPLSPKMIEYALNDVRYLIEMGNRITDRLKQLGRYDWFTESCDAARQKVVERTEQKEDNWRIQGSGRLSRHGLAFLRALWLWRDNEARVWDRPTFMVASNKQLIQWCENLLEGKKPSLPRHFRSDRVKRFHQAAQEAAALGENDWPHRPKGVRLKRPRDFEQRLDGLIEARNEVAKTLDIEGSLIAPRATLEALANEAVEPADVLLKWQRLCLSL